MSSSFLVVMKRKSPPSKNNSAARGEIPSVTGDDSDYGTRSVESVNIFLGSRSGSSVKMSEADFDHYKFLVDLNQQSRLGLTKSDLLGLIYENNCVPWTEKRRCSCTPLELDDKNEDEGDCRPLASDCDPGTGSMLTKTTQERNADKHMLATSTNIVSDNFSNINLICAACDGVQICGFKKQSETAGTGKFESHSFTNSCLHPGGLVTLPTDPIPQLPKKPKCSKICVCVLFGDPCPCQRKTTRGDKPLKSKSLASILCSCFGSTSVSSNVSHGRQIECTHEEFLHCEPVVETVGPNYVTKEKPYVSDLYTISKSTGSLPILLDTGTLQDVEDPHARCCRIIRLSEREHLLLCRFEKAQKWCVKLNMLLKRYSVRIFLLRRCHEIHVRGLKNFEHARIQILKKIRNATAWWDSDRKKVQYADSTKQSSFIEPDPADGLTAQELLTSTDSAVIGDESSSFVSVQNTVAASTVDEGTQETIYRCDLFPDCPLTAVADTEEQLCHRFVLNQLDYSKLNQQDRRRNIIAELNLYLVNQNVRIHLLHKQRELHIRGCGQDRQKLLQIVWEVAPDPKFQTRILPILAMIETPSSGNYTSAGAQPELFCNNGPTLPRSSVHGCVDYPDCELEGPSRCYTIPLDALVDYGILHLKSETEGLIENMNEKLGKHGISISLLSKKAELHLKSSMEDVDHACAILIEASKDYDVAQYFPVSLKSYLITSPAYAERIVAPLQQPSAFTETISPSTSGTTSPFGLQWSDKGYPECINQRGPRWQIIPINPNDETHAKLLDWNRVSKFVSRLNEHFADLSVTVRLLESQPEFHVYGQCAEVVVPTLMDITSGIRTRFDIMKRLLFLYPKFARKMNLGWNKGERGPCKCHGTVNIVVSVPTPVISSSSNPPSSPRPKGRNRRLRKKSKRRSASIQPSGEDEAQPGNSNLFPPAPNNGGNMQYSELAPLPSAHYVQYDPNRELYPSPLLLPSDRVIRDRYSHSLFPRQYSF